MNIMFDTTDMIDAKYFTPGSNYNNGDCTFLVQYSDYTFDIVNMITKGNMHHKQGKEREHIIKWILLNDNKQGYL